MERREIAECAVVVVVIGGVQEGARGGGGGVLRYMITQSEYIIYHSYRDLTKIWDSIDDTPSIMYLIP